ncbi:unnamed protein product [Amoebophrya sp. A120]|nr:unnamed protein product [Amoebophrya sp. A120]|eukprot:GSA120T00002129001.1
MPSTKRRKVLQARRVAAAKEGRDRKGRVICGEKKSAACRTDEGHHAVRKTGNAKGKRHPPACGAPTGNECAEDENRICHVASFLRNSIISSSKIAGGKTDFFELTKPCHDIFCDLAQFPTLRLDLRMFLPPECFETDASTTGSDAEMGKKKINIEGAQQGRSDDTTTATGFPKAAASNPILLDIHQDLRPNLQHTGGIVWETSYLLALLLCHRWSPSGAGAADGPMYDKKARRKFARPDFPQTILELGSGCGFLGLALAKLFPEAEVLLTEYEPAMENLTKNVAANKAKDDQHRTENLAACKQVDWLKTQKNPTEPDTRFQYIVATDVIFDKKLVEPLLKTMFAYSVRSTDVYLCVQERCQAAHEEFLRLRPKYFDRIEELKPFSTEGADAGKEFQATSSSQNPSCAASPATTNTLSTISTDAGRMRHLLKTCATQEECLIFKISRARIDEE